MKLFGFPAAMEGGNVALFSLIGLAAVLELVGGALLLVGLFTRPVAFLLAGEMAVAYWMAHAPQSVFPMLNGGDVRHPLLLRLPLPRLRRPRRLQPRRPPHRGPRPDLTAARLDSRRPGP